MPEQTLTAFPRFDFLPKPTEMAKGPRLRYLVERQTKTRTDYQASYSAIIQALDALESGSMPALEALGEAKKTLLKDHLLRARDNVAQAFTQSITFIENNANELLPGTYEREDVPTTSYDIGELIDRVLSWLANLLRDIGDVFGDLGMPEVESGLDWAADRVDDLNQFLKDNIPDLD